MRGPTDAELLARIADGDEPALRDLMTRHAPWLLLRLQRRTSDEGIALEALNDTFVAVWRRAAAFRGDGDVGAWLWGIAIRRLVSRLRLRSAPVPVASQLLSALSPSVRSAEDDLLVALEHGPVGQVFGALSPELRQVLQATVLDGLSTREAAQLLGIPQGTVKSRLRTAKTRLRQQLLAAEGVVT